MVKGRCANGRECEWKVNVVFVSGSGVRIEESLE